MQINAVPPIVLVLGSVLVLTCAHVALKFGARVLPVAEGPLLLLLAASTSAWLWVGLICHVVALALWVLALAKTPLSYAYPFMAIGFVMTSLISYAVLGESMSPLRWVGTAVICVGVLIVSRS